MWLSWVSTPLPLLEPHVGDPAAMAQRVRQAVSEFAAAGKVTGVLGGDHSVAIGSAQAHAESIPRLSVLYLDAHPDLRDEYQGTQWGHASSAPPSPGFMFLGDGRAEKHVLRRT